MQMCSNEQRETGRDIERRSSNEHNEVKLGSCLWPWLKDDSCPMPTGFAAPGWVVDRRDQCVSCFSLSVVDTINAILFVESDFDPKGKNQTRCSINREIFFCTSFSPFICTSINIPPAEKQRWCLFDMTALRPFHSSRLGDGYRRRRARATRKRIS